MTTRLIYPILFIIGAAGYCFLEICWRGYTHWSMALAGAVSLMFMGFLCFNFNGLPILIKALISAAFITGVELISGVLFNLYLKLDVWDYSSLAKNYAGQICPQYCTLWFAISFALIFVMEKVFYNM